MTIAEADVDGIAANSVEFRDPQIETSRMMNAIHSAPAPCSGRALAPQKRRLEAMRTAV